MAQGEGFKHITVTAAEEEDVVIMAGMGDAAAQEEGESASGPELVSEPEPEIAPEPEPAPEPAPEPTPAPKPQRKPKAKDEYQETTLSDLQDQSMPLAQRIVIIAAIICIIGAVIYCVAFMR